MGTATGYLTLDATKFENTLKSALSDLTDFGRTAQNINLGSGLTQDLEDITQAASRLSGAASDIRGLGAAADSSVSDFSRLAQEQRDLNRNMDDVSDETSQIVQALRDLKESADKVTGSLDSMNKELEDSGEESEKAAKKLEGSSSKLKDIASGIGSGVVAIGAGAVAIGGAAINSASEVDAASRNLASSLNLTGEELERYNAIAENVYKNNFGESLTDISGTLALIRQQMGDMADDEMQQTVQAAYMLQDAYGIDISESIRGANAMMNQFGISATEAYNLMAQGAEKGLNQNQDLSDQIAEYATYYGQLGFTAEETFNMMANAAETGVYQIDKVNDAVKEFGIRSIDMSKSSVEAYELIGMDAEEMSAKFAQGGEVAKQSFADVVKAIKSIEDPVKQNAAGVGLFGTMWEDIGKEAVFALADTDAAIDSTRDKLGELEETAYGGLEAETQSLQRSLTLMLVPLGKQLMPLGSQLIEMVSPFLEEVIPALTEAVVPIFDSLSQELIPILMEFIQQVIPPLMGLTKNLLPFISQLIQSLMPIALDLFGALVPVIVELVEQLLPPLLSIVESLTPLVSSILEVLEPILGVVVNLIEPIGGVLELLVPLINTLSELLLNGLEPLIPAIEFVAELFGYLLTDALNLVMSLITDYVIPVFEGYIKFLQGDFQGGIQSVCEGITGLFQNAFEFIDTILGTNLSSWYNKISQASFDFGKMMADTFNASENELNELHSKYSDTYREMLSLYADYYKQGMDAQAALAMAYQQSFTSAEAQYTFRESFAESLTQGSLSEQLGTTGLSTEELLAILEKTQGGDTYNFYSPEAIDEYTAAQEMKEAKKDLVEGF